MDGKFSKLLNDVAALSNMVVPPVVEAPPLAAPVAPSGMTDLHTLVQRAQAGDATALPQIREILDSRPDIWHHMGDVSSLVERAWIALLAADNPLSVESMKRTVAEMKAELAGEQPTRLERMMVEQVIANWMEVKYLEGSAAAAGRGSLEQANFRLKRLESAQRRYLEAIKMLTSLRAMMPSGLAATKPLKIFEPKRTHQA